MTNQDALVAEAVGYTVEEMVNEGGDLEPYMSKNPDAPISSWQKLAPFISAPTVATDQIVKTWLKKQRNDIAEPIRDELAIIWFERAKVPPIDYNYFGWRTVLLVMIDHEEPGDYAQALLAIQEERGDDR